MQMCVMEMSDRPDKPLFHLEHYIEGKYIKYNSNSGFVKDDNIRLTPQVGVIHIFLLFDRGESLCCQVMRPVDYHCLASYCKK